MRRTWLVGTIMASLSGAQPAGAQTAQRLYDGPAPGSAKWSQAEVATPTPDGGTIFTNVRDPELVTYAPAPGAANGVGVILLPGGGLRLLGVAGDAREAIARMTAQGITVFVLKYRTLQGAKPPTPPVGGPPKALPAFPKFAIRNGNANPSPDDPTLREVLDLAVADAQRAMLTVRRHAARWKIDPARVGMMGFSAGGGVAIGVVVRDAPGTVPDFLVSLYGPSLMDVTVPGDAPPAFLATETDHGPVTDGLVALYALWKSAGKHAELHAFDTKGSLRFDLWSDRYLAWLRERGMLAPQPRP